MTKPDPKKILIVEDDADIAGAMADVLGKLEYEIAGVVTTGEEAVDKIFEIKPDLIIMDVVLDGRINGIEASRQLEQFVDIPIIFTTGHRPIATAMQSNKRIPLLKPFTKEELQHAIHTALASSATQTPPPTIP